MLMCKDMPLIKEFKKQSEVAIYITNLHNTAQDCKDKLEDLKLFLKEENGEQ